MQITKLNQDGRIILHLKKVTGEATQVKQEDRERTAA